MELKDKIIMLRKQNALSQEGLAEKLNVTRQTISKWELGETKPSVDMLNEMSKIFNVGIEVLTNDEIGLDSKKEKVKKPKNRKYILYILIVILIAAVITLAIRIGNDRKDKENKFWNFFDSTFSETSGKIDIEQFNGLLENGTRSGFFLSSDIDEIIDSNKTNKEHLIEVIFDGTSYGKSAEKISELKDKINDGVDSKYEVSLDYDKEGYVNKVTITTKETVSATSFNHMFEFNSGTQYNTSVRDLLDDVITSNNKHKDHLVEVVYQGTSYGTDAQGIRNAKNVIGTNTFKENGHGFIEYEVSLDYDDKGYVIKITIEKL